MSAQVVLSLLHSQPLVHEESTGGKKGSCESVSPDAAAFTYVTCETRIWQSKLTYLYCHFNHYFDFILLELQDFIIQQVPKTGPV